jgi:exodeoxyribonuclease V alpha subunit
VILPQTAHTATGLLQQFNQAGVIGLTEYHVASRLARLCGEHDPEVVLAAALCVKALERGSVCLNLDDVRELGSSTADQSPLADQQPPWPDTASWLNKLAGSSMIAAGTEIPRNARPLRLTGTQLYLEREWSAQSDIATALAQRNAAQPPAVDPQALATATARLSDSSDGHRPSEQQLTAIQLAVRNWTTVITGGPGTGKTTIVRLLLKVLGDPSVAGIRKVALAAFTGKAANRIQEVVGGEFTATTLHRLLGSRGPGRGFSHDANNPLRHDLVIIDEASMISMALMRQLLSALPQQCRLILLGDKDQLQSVEAGAVFADIIDALKRRSNSAQGVGLIELQGNRRNAPGIAQFAGQILDGAADPALETLSSVPEISFVDGDAASLNLDRLPEVSRPLLAQATAVADAAQNGDSATALTHLSDFRVLCVHQDGPAGVSRWAALIDGWLRHRLASGSPPGSWWVGRTVLLGRNMPELGLNNGDQGVLVHPTGSDNPLVCFEASQSSAERLYPIAVLDHLQPLYAMTVHKSQGSEYDSVAVLLPEATSPLLTRQLLYTACTRARTHLTIVGNRDALRKAIQTPALRASGLADQLFS